MRFLASSILVSMVSVVLGAGVETIYAPAYYDCDGADTTFTFTWDILNTSAATHPDLVVTLVDADGGETILVENSDYGVSAANDDFREGPGGTVTTTLAYESGYQIVLSRESEVTQSAAYLGSSVRPATIGLSLDKLTLISQDLSNRMARSIEAPIGSEVIDMNLPAGFAGDVGYLYWDDGWVLSLGTEDSLTASAWGQAWILLDSTASAKAQMFASGLYTKNGSTSAGPVDFYEDSDNGTNRLRVMAQAMAADWNLTWPAADGSSGHVLKTDGAGTLAFADVNTVGGGDMFSSTYDVLQNDYVDGNDTAYNATSWNGNPDAASKNALRDKIETMADIYADGSVPFDSFVDINDTGVKLTGDDGSLTLLGLGDGADEDMTIDLDTTANTITISSSTGANLYEFENAGIDVNHVDFATTDGEAIQQGRIKWDVNDQTLALGMEGGTVNLQIGQEIVLRARNDTGTTITNGTCAYISGGLGDNAVIGRADANDPVKNGVIGMATEDISDGTNGYVTAHGLVRGLNTSAFAAGGVAWLGTNGAFTDLRPTPPAFQAAVGIVTRSHANEGVVYCNPYIIPILSGLSDVSSTPGQYDILQWSSGDLRFEDTNTPSFRSLPLVGDDANYVEVDADGDLAFVGNAGLAYGEISVNGNATPTTIGSGSTWYQVNVFDTSQQNNATASADTNDITIIEAGAYMVTASISFSGATSGNIYELQVQTNNGATPYLNLHCDRKIGTGGDVGSASISGIGVFAASDTVELWIQNTSAGNNATVRDCTLSIVQIGGSG